MNSKQSGFGVIELLLIVVTIGLIGALGWIAYDRQVNKDESQAATAIVDDNKNTDSKEKVEQKETEPLALAKGTFGVSNEWGEYGTLQAEGYGTTVTRNKSPYCESNCEQEEYAFFNITRTENPTIFPYLERNGSNAFSQNRAIGMGCLVNGEISGVNISSAGFGKNIIPSADTAAILAATAENPIALDIEKLESGPGVGAPSCYSIFATFKVIK